MSFLCTFYNRVRRVPWNRTSKKKGSSFRDEYQHLLRSQFYDSGINFYKLGSDGGYIQHGLNRRVYAGPRSRVKQMT